MDNLLGQTLDHYKILALLGEGGMGSVYKAYDITLQVDVAIKIMHPNFAHQPNFQERFLQEARSAARLKHAGIVHINDFGQDRGQLFIVMDFIPGDNLAQMLADLKKEGKWIMLSEAVQIVRAVSLTLDFAHKQGVLHRDVKPGNIMIAPTSADGLPYSPVLTDLGLAKLMEGGLVTTEGTSMGTPAYMSPEQALGKETDPRSDVYSLGVLLFELATGSLPFPARTLTEAIRYHTQEPPPVPRSLRPDLPETLEQIILKAMQKDPAQRFQTAADLAHALDGVAQAVTKVVIAPTALESAVSLVTQHQKSLVRERGNSIFDEFAPVSDASQDRIQVLPPNHTSYSVQVRSASLAIGREKDNDIVLQEDGKISRHHARIEFDGHQYHIVDLNSTNGTFLANARLLPGVPEPWTPDKALRIGDHWLRLARAGAAQAAPFGKGSQADPATHTEDSSGDPGSPSSYGSPILSSPGDGRVGIWIDPAPLVVEPGQSLRLPVSVINQGSLVDHLSLGVTGIPLGWAPAQSPAAQLMPGEKRELTLVIQPPRNSQSRAGRYPITVRATSLDAAGQVAEVQTSLTVAPYSQFTSELQPQRPRAGQPARLVITNLGNFPEAFNINLNDRGDELAFTPPKALLRVPEADQAVLEFRAAPRQQRLIGSEKTHPFQADVAIASGQTQSPTGEILSRALIPVWLPPLLAFLCLLAAGSLAALYPSLAPKPTPTLTPQPTLVPGPPIFPVWCVYPQGQPPAALDSCPTQVIVTQGQKVTIQWEVSQADSVQIDPLGDRPLKGQEDFLPLTTINFTLKGSNQAKSTQRTIQIVVELPTSTPSPVPSGTSVPTDTPQPTGTPTLTPTETLTPTPTESPSPTPLPKAGDYGGSWTNKNASTNDLASLQITVIDDHSANIHATRFVSFGIVDLGTVSAVLLADGTLESQQFFLNSVQRLKLNIKLLTSNKIEVDIESCSVGQLGTSCDDKINQLQKDRIPAGGNFPPAITVGPIKP